MRAPFVLNLHIEFTDHITRWKGEQIRRSIGFSAAENQFELILDTGAHYKDERKIQDREMLGLLARHTVTLVGSGSSACSRLASLAT